MQGVQRQSSRSNGDPKFQKNVCPKGEGEEMRLKFIKEKEESDYISGASYDYATVEMTVEGVTLDVVLQEFARFLQACGYAIPLCDHPLIINDEGEYE